MLRIIAGEFGGRLLQAPKGDDTRPTSDRVKESLFSILGADFTGLYVIDLFAGTGSLGLEALSRGASHVVLVEKEPAPLRCIRANIEALGVRDRVGYRRAIRAARDLRVRLLTEPQAPEGQPS